MNLDDEVGRWPKITLLGMVCSDKPITPSRGQRFRDWVRCDALEKMGWELTTIDNKHNSHRRHCCADFNSRKFFEDVLLTSPAAFGADIVMLDYFFGPTGWCDARWRPSFFTNTLPDMAKLDFVVRGGAVVLPNLPYVREQIDTTDLSFSSSNHR